MPCRSHDRRCREGIALIAVLSFLGIILVLAIALTSTMRTERMVSESARDNAAAEIILDGALDSAMQDINSFLRHYTNSVGVQFAGETPNTIRPGKRWAIITSIAPPSEPSADVTNVTKEAALFSESVHMRLPRQFVFMTNDVDLDGFEACELAEWVNIRDPVSRAGANQIIGRYAYAAFDCSGLLDVNLIGEGPRREGINISEISVNVVADLTNVPSGASRLLDNRDLYHRFESLREVMTLNDGSGTGEAEAILPDELMSFVPYSLTYDNGWWDWDAGVWREPGRLPNGTLREEQIDLWTENDALAVFTELSYPKPQDMAWCFSDYTDADLIPGGSAGANTGIACCEPIPMINEIVVTNYVSITPSAVTPGFVDVQHFFTILIETWYPYVGFTNANSYRVRLNGFSAQYFPTTPPLFDMAPSPPLAFPYDGPSFVPDTNQPFQVFRFDFRSAVSTVASVPPPDQARISPFNNFDVSIIDESTSGSPIVDRVNGAGSANFDLRLTVNLRNGQRSASSGTSVNDPRVNHDLATWRKVASTTNAPNDTYPEYNISVVSPATNRLLEGPDFYIANKPMNWVSELGFIHQGFPWSTIDLFSQEGIDLLTWFRDDEWTAKRYTNGLVNPNTIWSNVVVAMFQDAPIDRFPGDDAYSNLNKEAAGRIAASFVKHSTSNAFYIPDQFYSPAAWAWVPALTMVNDPLFLGLDNNQREAVIRNSYRLFNPNQNLFVLLVIAQSVIDRGDSTFGSAPDYGRWDPQFDVITGEKRAVALVWRDPFPNENGRHEMFVQQLKILDD
jgi:hypothetical protein